MEDYPAIPLYRSDEIDILKKAADPKISVVLPRRLWNSGIFKQLPTGSKLLYGILLSKLACGSAEERPGGTACIELSNERRQDLLGCSLRSAQTYIDQLSRSGYITTDKNNRTGKKGRPSKNIYIRSDADVSGKPAAVIPISLFSRDDFIDLPDGAKLLFGMIFAKMTAGKGYSDTLGNYCLHNPRKKVIKLCDWAGVTYRRHIDNLCESGFIAKLQLDAAEHGADSIDLIYVRRLAGNKDTETAGASEGTKR